MPINSSQLFQVCLKLFAQVQLDLFCAFFARHCNPCYLTTLTDVEKYQHPCWSRPRGYAHLLAKLVGLSFMLKFKLSHIIFNTFKKGKPMTNTKTQEKCFIAIVFPSNETKLELTELASRFIKNLTDACNVKPEIFRSEAKAFPILIKGERDKIIAALELSCAIDTRYLLAEMAGETCISRGLSIFDTWVRRNNVLR
jgi:hypothetical protein